MSNPTHLSLTEKLNEAEALARDIHAQAFHADQGEPLQHHLTRLLGELNAVAPATTKELARRLSVLVADPNHPSDCYLCEGRHAAELDDLLGNQDYLARVLYPLAGL